MYKAIVVHVDASAQDSTLRAAAQLANTFDAHLIGSAVTGMSWPSYALLGGQGYPNLIEQTYNGMRVTARARLAAFEERAQDLGVQSIETRLAEDEAGYALLLQARFADLIVLGQTTVSDPTLPTHMHGLAEHVVLEGARPVLVVPDAYGGEPLAGTVVVGWDGSTPAVRAIVGALPLLRRARSVKLVQVNPPHQPFMDGDDPGTDMAAYLTRHGVPVELVSERAPDGAGAVLLARAAAEGASLIVAGAFGHSRFREWVLGGATRDLLDRARIPVLFAH